MEIPPRPGILNQIFLKTRQEEPDFLKLATLISEDLSLSASLIKMAVRLERSLGLRPADAYTFGLFQDQAWPSC